LPDTTLHAPELEAADPNSFMQRERELMAVGRAEDAEAVLGRGVSLHPSHGGLLSSYARAAQRRADWAEALKRWTAFQKIAPDDAVGYSGVGLALGELALAQLRQADVLLLEGLARHPRSADILGTYARLAQRRNDWLETLSRWALVRQRLPDDAAGLIGMGNAFRELRQLNEARNILSEASRRFPADREVLIALIRLAEDEHDWAEVLRGWNEIRRQSADDPVVYEKVELALNNLGRPDEAREVAEEAARRFGRRPLSELFLQFESLGENCQFGIVQDCYGAFPLGLLRFTATSVGPLIKALDNRLAGVGDSKNTEVTTLRGEYVTQDMRYGMVMHTFQKVQSAPDQTRRVDRFVRRLKFLREKLLQDLSNPGKTFVYSCSVEILPEEIEALWQALQQYGDNALLFVQLADDDNAPGTVRQVRDTLFIGYIDQLTNEAPSLSIWLALCQEVKRLQAELKPSVPRGTEAQYDSSESLNVAHAGAIHP
jgi:Flp pilus assembly protein TadD